MVAIPTSVFYDDKDAAPTLVRFAFCKRETVIAEKFPQAQFFAGQLVFKDESTITRWLHNHTVFELQRRLYQIGRAMLILPIQV